MKRIGNGNRLPAETNSVVQQIAVLRQVAEAEYRGEVKAVVREPEPTPGTAQWLVWVDEGVRQGTMTKLQADAAKASWAVKYEPPKAPAIYDVSYHAVCEKPTVAPSFAPPSPPPAPREPIDVFGGTEGAISIPAVLLAVLVTILMFPWVGAFLNYIMRGGQPWVPGMN